MCEGRELTKDWQHVEPDGTYVKHGRQTAASAAASERGHYLTMMSARIALVGGAAGSLGRAATIAVRYSLVRRQGFQSSSASGGSFRAPENQVRNFGRNLGKFDRVLWGYFAIFWHI